MGADIKSLRLRIKSVDSTLHLTRAMGLVASSKIRRATDAMLKARQYREAVEQTVKALCASAECQKSPYMQKREGDRLRLVVIAGDRGLAGGYNANVFRLLRTLPRAEIIPIGKRASDRFGDETVRAEGYSFECARALAETLCADFRDGKYDRLGIVRTRYESMMTQEATVDYVLPLLPKEGVMTTGAIFEPDEITVLDAAIPEYVAGLLLHAVRESFASEVAARRCAMDSAGKNAEEMIRSLELEYNRARQGAITQEITEIVAGGNA